MKRQPHPLDGTIDLVAHVTRYLDDRFPHDAGEAVYPLSKRSKQLVKKARNLLHWLRRDLEVVRVVDQHAEPKGQHHVAA